MRGAIAHVRRHQVLKAVRQVPAVLAAVPADQARNRRAVAAVQVRRPCCLRAAAAQVLRCRRACHPAASRVLNHRVCRAPHLRKLHQHNRRRDLRELHRERLLKHRLEHRPALQAEAPADHLALARGLVRHQVRLGQEHQAARVPGHLRHLAASKS